MKYETERTEQVEINNRTTTIRHKRSADGSSINMNLQQAAERRVLLTSSVEDTSEPGRQEQRNLVSVTSSHEELL